MDRNTNHFATIGRRRCDRDFVDWDTVSGQRVFCLSNCSARVMRIYHEDAGAGASAITQRQVDHVHAGQVQPAKDE